MAFSFTLYLWLELSRRWHFALP